MDHANKKRSLAKTVTWRVIATTDTILIAKLLTDSWSIGFGIASIEVVTKFILYYLHERGWAAADWGIDEPGTTGTTPMVQPYYNMGE
jgi:uncharacterized membrane protein